MMDFTLSIHEQLVTICLCNVYILSIRMHRLPTQGIYILLKIMNGTYLL